MSNIIFRPIAADKGAITAQIELPCFPPNEACTPKRISAHKKAIIRSALFSRKVKT